MMLRRRSPLGVLLMVAFGVLLGAALFGGAEAVGSLVAAPFVVLGFIFKVILFFVLFGLVVKLFVRSSGRRNRDWSGPSHEWWSDQCRPRRPGWRDSSESDQEDHVDDRFEEWHRMAHARREVDEHTPPVED